MSNYSVLTCNRYTSEKTCDTIDEAIAWCAMRERDTNDGYARVVSHDGRLVADTSGPWKRDGMSAYERLEVSGDAL